MNGMHDVKFVASGRGKAQCEPDLNYPHGKEVSCVFATETPCCTVALPYPAPECGYYAVRCQVCQMSVAVTAVGRPDDPISVTIPCRRDRSGGIA